MLNQVSSYYLQIWWYKSFVGFFLLLQIHQEIIWIVHLLMKFDAFHERAIGQVVKKLWLSCRILSRKRVEYWSCLEKHHFNDVFKNIPLILISMNMKYELLSWTLSNLEQFYFEHHHVHSKRERTIFEYQ